MEGMNADEVEALLARFIPQTRVFGIADDLKYAVKGGRVPAWVKKVADLLRLNPVLTEPTSVMLSYRWMASDMCELAWMPSASATTYRIEEASSPAFDDAALIAELTDTRQPRYSISPPASSARSSEAKAV